MRDKNKSNNRYLEGTVNQMIRNIEVAAEIGSAMGGPITPVGNYTNNATSVTERILAIDSGNDPAVLDREDD